MLFDDWLFCAAWIAILTGSSIPEKRPWVECMLKIDHLLPVAGLVMMVTGTSLSARAAADELFAGIWAKSCAPQGSESRLTGEMTED